MSLTSTCSDVVFRLARLAVAAQNLFRPHDQILRPLPRGMSGNPEFKIVGAVVGTHPVAMMDVFPRHQIASKLLLHDEAVLRNLTGAICLGMVGRADQHIPKLADVFFPALAQVDIRRPVPLDAVPMFGAPARTVGRFDAALRVARYCCFPTPVPIGVMLPAHTAHERLDVLASVNSARSQYFRSCHHSNNTTTLCACWR